jgi:hypothetical protein
MIVGRKTVTLHDSCMARRHQALVNTRPGNRQPTRVDALHVEQSHLLSLLSVGAPSGHCSE